jgi:hypothetical protein
VPEITKQEIASELAEISRITSDATEFLKFRVLMEAMVSDAAKGDDAADELLGLVQNFYRLCRYVESRELDGSKHRSQ